MPRLSSSCPLALLLFVAEGCAVFTCQPITVVVAEKQERRRIDLVPIGFRTDETGRVEEVETVRVVLAYWVRSAEGGWSVCRRRGRPAEVCR